MDDQEWIRPEGEKNARQRTGRTCCCDHGPLAMEFRQGGEHFFIFVRTRGHLFDRWLAACWMDLQTSTTKGPPFPTER
jgi:hypothetical protein